MRTLLATTLIVLAFAPALARADVVDPEPDRCPPGSTPATAHSGPYCAPIPDCTSDSACTGATCMAVTQCIETRGCGGREVPDAAPCTLEHVVGPCNADGTCATGTCRARHVCSNGSTAAGGCGCRAAGSSSPHPSLALPALALLLALRRRD